MDGLGRRSNGRREPPGGDGPVPLHCVLEGHDVVGGHDQGPSLDGDELLRIERRFAGAHLDSLRTTTR